MKNTSSRSTSEFEVKVHFVVILILTLVLLTAFTIGTFIVMNLEGDEPTGDRDNNSGPNNPQTEQTSVTTDDPPSSPAGSNTTPLFPTNETRTSYKVTTGVGAVNLSTEIKSNNTILVKVGSDSLTSIVEKNADAKMFPASMTKVMTLIVACERVTDLNKKLIVTKQIADYAEEQDGSGAGLKVGDSYTVEDLLFLISYKSDTIASILIAEHIAGSEAAFVDLMNQKAVEIGLTGTRFANCTGLYNENNYSTCRDFASIMAYALDNEMTYKCLSSFKGREMVVGGVDCTFYSAWYSVRFKDNPRLSTVTVKAAKTGYIDESGFSLVSYAEGKDKDGNLCKYICVIVGLPKGSGLSESMSTDEVKKLYNTYAKNS